jgi:hypothetical protein
MFYYYIGRLLDYIPSVQCLTVRVYTDLQNFSKYSSIKYSPLINSNLRSLQISTINNIPFNQIENFFKNLFNRLETLKFFFKTDASSQSCLDYINDKRWEYLLQSFLSLHHFSCCIELPIQSQIITNSFEKNQFFLKRNWRFSVQIYTYSFNTILCLHTKPYPKKRLDIMYVIISFCSPHLFIFFCSLAPQKHLSIILIIFISVYVIFTY